MREKIWHLKTFGLKKLNVYHEKNVVLKEYVALLGASDRKKKSDCKEVHTEQVLKMAGGLIEKVKRVQQLMAHDKINAFMTYDDLTIPSLW